MHPSDPPPGDGWVSVSECTGGGVVPELVRDGMDEFGGFVLR